MNTELEDAPLEEIVIPEVLTNEQVQAIQHPDALLQQLEACKTRFTILKPVDDLTVKQCAALIETCAFASRYAESRRTAITEPLNKQVKDANAIWMPIVKGFEEIARVRGVDVAKFIEDERREAARLQQKKIDDAKAEQDRLDRLAEEERTKAENLRLEALRLEEEEKARVAKVETDRLAAEQKIKDDEQALIDAKARGDEAAARLAQQDLDDAKAAEAQKVIDDEQARVAAQAEQDRLNKLATKADTKSEKAELAASNVVTEVVATQSRTIDTGSATFGARAPKKTWILAGYDKAKPLKITDPILASLIGAIDKLPEGIKFVLQHSDLNPVYLNKSFGVIKFPSPFAETDNYGGSSVRDKRGK